VEMGRIRDQGWRWVGIRGGVRDQEVEMSRIRGGVREELDMDLSPPPGFCVLQCVPSQIFFTISYMRSLCYKNIL